MSNRATYQLPLMEAVLRGEATDRAVYLIGIGGIGMSALARFFKSRGLRVSGYDRTATELTRTLEMEGMLIHYTDNVDLLDQQAELVVITPAVPTSHTELGYFLTHDYPVMKRSEVLGLITAATQNICVAGTHGKTTTSCMVAHILTHTGYGCNAFLGGIASNYGTNFWGSERNVSVVEADEYDRSFLKLTPEHAIITAVDPDHLDIYDDEQSFRQAFIDFSQKVKPDGTLVVQYNIPDRQLLTHQNLVTYSLENQLADYSVTDCVVQTGAYHFSVKAPDVLVPGFTLHMGGLHNVENALAAIIVARSLGIDMAKIQSAIATFNGVKRRFEYVVRRNDRVLIDDYAHHPEELRALLLSVRNLLPARRVLTIFQPHLFSRTRDFVDGFATSLSLSDEVILLPIYPARELPMEGVTSERIAERMNADQVQCLDRTATMRLLSERHMANQLDVVITAGAGDIDTMVNELKKLLTESHGTTAC
ncbi:MAG: UDP-N-acetylmuramate--L-alanine ligase [Ferruginibacter sp.]